jgi:hypothetical protein
MKYVRKSERILRHRKRVRLEEPAYDFVDSLKCDFPLSVAKFDLELVKQEIKIVEGALRLLESVEYKELYSSLSSVIEEIRKNRVCLGKLVYEGLSGHGKPDDDSIILEIRRREAILIETASHIENQICLLCESFGTLCEPFLMVRQNFGVQPGAQRGTTE